MRFILGVDPGAGGALALYDPVTNEATLHDMPTIKIIRGGKVRRDIDGYGLGMLIDGLRHDIRKAYVEQVGGRPGQAGQFQFGDNYGVLKGVLYANLIPVKLVPSNKWKPALGLHRAAAQNKSDMKDEARRRASQMFPHLAAEMTRKKDDGRAESLLIAVYGAIHGNR